MSQDDQLCRCDEAAPRETDDGLKNDVCLGLFFYIYTEFLGSEYRKKGSEGYWSRVWRMKKAVKFLLFSVSFNM